MQISKEILDYIDAHHEEAFQLLVQLAKIPAPSHHEERRAAFCKAWLERQGAKNVSIDDALNVIYPVGCVDSGPLVVFMAHSDVVFPDMDELPLVIADGRIKCPGAGDDTANVVALLMAAKYIAERRLEPCRGGLLLVVNSCEEGLGNLKGSRQIMERFGSRVTEFFSFDGCCDKATNHAVGSRRYRIEVRTEGGHSYGKFGNRNAIAYLASLIDTLYTMKPPENSRTTYNVGTIQGGTSVNTIAQQAEMLYEYRSDQQEAMQVMEQHLDAAVAFYRAKGVQVNVELLGDRPCMGRIDLEKERELMERTSIAVHRYFGHELEFGAASTDCNIPLSMGIPSICVGCYRGGGLHTREEYVEIDSLLPGLKLSFDLILHYLRNRTDNGET